MKLLEQQPIRQTSRSADGTERKTVTPNKSDTSADTILGLQHSIGNAATAKLLAGGGPSLHSTASPAIKSLQRRVQVQRAGDKIAFGSTTVEDSEAKQKIQAVIDQHRDNKRITKANYETEKERSINENNEFYKDNETQRIGAHKRVLKTYHHNVQVNAGWKWSALKSEIMATVPGVQFDEKYIRPSELNDPSSVTGYARIIGPNQSSIFYVYFGNSRFATPVNGSFPKAIFGKSQHSSGVTFHHSDNRSRGSSNVYFKHGTYEHTLDGRPLDSKQFVKDANGVYTRRFVTRAITIYHLANMLGSSVRDPDRTSEMTNEQLDQAVPTVTQNVDSEGRQRFEQLPRYEGRSFGVHDDTFDLNSIATVGNNNLLHNSAYGEKRGVNTGLLIASGSPRIARNSTNSMKLNERASMQVRNGTGGGNHTFQQQARSQDRQRRLFEQIRESGSILELRTRPCVAST